MKSKKAPRKPVQKPAAESPPGDKTAPLEPYMAVIGGGAASVNPLTQLLARLPSKPGMAFIYVPNNERTAQRKLAEFLAISSVLPVVEVKSATPVQPDTLYLIPAGRKFVFEEGSLVPANARLAASSRDGRVDLLFSSLAQSRGQRVIGILLAGEGADGVQGLTQIKAEGGLTFLQEPSPGQDGELQVNALAANAADFVCSPRKIAEELLRFRDLAASNDLQMEDKARQEVQLHRVFTILRAFTGVDFSLYKPSTVERRIRRRMVMAKTGSVSDYVSYLQRTPTEVDALYQDLLINVTSFFRDPPVFQALKKRIFPSLLKNRPRDSALRIWVPGCASGEEVYSIAISLVEFLGRAGMSTPIQVFATDISDTSLAKARTGIYPETIATHVSAQRLRRFFRRTEGGYQITKYIRDMCVFARQNVFEDPPFSRVDLVSCRNVLIYVGPELQKKVIPVFYYALQPSGFLLLGSSETTGVFGELFKLVDRRNKIYQKSQGPVRPDVEFVPGLAPRLRAPTVALPEPQPRPLVHGGDITKQVDRILLSQYTPVGLVINSNLEVLQFRGKTGLYLEHAPGEATLNLLKMVRPGLATELRSLISRAVKQDARSRKDNIAFRVGRHEHLVNLEVCPFKNPPAKERFLLVTFSEPAGNRTDKTVEKSRRKQQGGTRAENEIMRLREDLLSTRESLQSIIEEQEATNEELKSANEEIQSSNEELQSTNEELEAAKEELQSTNEELTTLNEELQTRNAELSQANNDLSNLLSSVNIPILILGEDLTIRRYTPGAEKIFNLLPTDVGRPVSDINSNLLVENLAERVAEVIETLKTYEDEVQDRTGRWQSLRIRPYRTSENKIEGAVVVLVDIDEIKRTLEELNELAREPLLILRGDFEVMRANRAFYKHFKLTPEEVENTPVFQLSKGAWNFPGLRLLLEGVLPEKRKVENYKLEQTFPHLGKQVFEASATIIHQQSKGKQLILLALLPAGTDV